MYKVLVVDNNSPAQIFGCGQKHQIGSPAQRKVLDITKALGLRRGREYHGKIPWKIPWKNTMEKYHGKMSWKNPAEPLNFDFTYSPLDFGY